MKPKKRALSAILSFVMLLQVIVPVFATNNVDTSQLSESTTISEGDKTTETKTEQTGKTETKLVEPEKLTMVQAKALTAKATNLPSEADGTKIETINVSWITEDSKADNNPAQLNQTWTDNDSKYVRMKLNFALSGQHDYPEGTVNIEIPKYIFKDRNGKVTGNMTLAVPEAPDKSGLFAYVDNGDTYILTNTKRLPAATSGMIETTIRDLKPSQIKDYATGYVTDDFNAKITVNTNSNNKIEKVSNNINAIVDTFAKISGAYKNGQRPRETWSTSFPDELKPSNPENYVFVEYDVHAYSSSNQPSIVEMVDESSSEVLGPPIVLGYKNSKTGTVVKGNGTNTLTDSKMFEGFAGTGQNFFGKVYVAYPNEKVESGVQYKLDNKVTFNMTALDDGEKTTTSATASVNYMKVLFGLPEGHFIVTKEGTGPTTKYSNGKFQGIYSYALNQLKDGKDVEIKTLYAADVVKYTGTQGGVTWTIYEDGELVFSPTNGVEGTFNNTNSSATTRPWSAYEGQYSSVRFEPGVKGGRSLSYMFRDSKATSLDLSNFDTSSVTDMSYMFNSSQATSLDLSSFDTSSVTNMGAMFSGSKATSLDLSNFDTSNVRNMSYMFAGSQATSIDLSNFDTSSVTNMANMFYNSQATSIVLSSFDTSSVTNMSYMFNSSKATSLDLSNFDTSNVTGMYAMFQNSQARSLDLSNFGTSNVTDMSYMFAGSQATSIDLSNFDTSSVTNMANMFYNSKATTGYARTQADADRFNASAKKPPTLTFVVKQAGQKYTGTQGGVTWTIYEDGELVFSPTNGVEGTFNNTNSSATTRPWSAYEGQYSSVRFEPGVKGGSGLSAMFSGSKATSLDLSNFDTSNVRNMSYMFAGSQATSIDLSNFDTSSVTNMANMFYNSQATSIVLSSFHTSSVTNMNYMFDSSKATSLDLSNFDTSNVTGMYAMFQNSQARSLDLSNFGTSSVTNMANMFNNSQATSLDLSNFDTSNVTDMSNMFNSSKATSLDLSNFDTSSVTNMRSMFQGSKATSLDLSNFDTSSVTNMYAMFNSSQARSLDLGPNFKWIGTNAYLPSSTTGGYTGKWIREDKTYGPYTPEELYSAYNNNPTALAGTWVAEKVPTEYKVLFDSNTGTGSLSPMIVEKDVKFVLPKEGITKFNHVFKEWNTSPDGSGTSYNVTTEVSNLTTPGNSITLYAIWEPQIGNVSITKQVLNYTEALKDKEYPVVVSLLDTNDKPLKGKYELSSNVGLSTLVRHDSTINIKKDEILTINNLPVGTKVSIKENVPEGFNLLSQSVVNADVTENTTAKLTLINEYDPVGSFRFEGSKSLYGADIKDFRFKFMVLKDGEVIQRIENDESGKILFEDIALTYEDIGKTYTYEIFESTDKQDNIIYDKNTFEVKVAISDDGKGNIIATVDTPTIAFSNGYKMMPATGTNETLLAISSLIGLLAIAIVVDRRKSEVVEEQ